jgi:RNA polymerase sigma-70 factor (ECF subfamily)
VKEAVQPARVASTQVSTPTYPPYFHDLYLRSEGQQFGLSFQEFAEILQEVSGRYLSAGASDSDSAEFHRGLRLEDLALARACARGSEPAWEFFLTHYRQKLYDAAGAIAKEDSIARELADSIYTDLFGTRQNEDGERISKLASYTGRGSLEGWLRTVLAQEYVNRYRKQRRLVSFEERTESGSQFEAKENTAAVSPDVRVEHAVDAALCELSAEERLILASYYLDGRTLAETARMLGVHESTISRRLEKITISLRKRMVRELKRRGMSAREMDEALQTDVRDLTVDIRGKLLQGKSG